MADEVKKDPFLSVLEGRLRKDVVDLVSTLNVEVENVNVTDKTIDKIKINAEVPSDTAREVIYMVRDTVLKIAKWAIIAAFTAYIAHELIPHIFH